MSDGQKTFLNLWAWFVVLFGAALAGGGLDVTDGLVKTMYALQGNPLGDDLPNELRFSIALMGAVTIGWGITFYAAFQAAHQLHGAQATGIWRLIMIAVVVWFVIDGALSVATGFWPNLIPNTGLLVTLLVPVLRSGVLKG